MDPKRPHGASDADPPVDPTEPEGASIRESRTEFLDDGSATLATQPDQPLTREGFSPAPPGIRLPATATQPGASAGAAAAPPSDIFNQVLGGCRIDKQIGQGGMGRVYRAHHLGLDQPMAVKVLDERLIARQGFVEGFFTEARTLAKLDHPNIVRVFNVDKAANGSHFIVMELLEGGSVQRLWAQAGKTLPIDDVVRIGREAAAGLAGAHKAGLIHRDVKPGNLMLGREDRVKVVDFGLAVNTQGELFIATGVAGTPHYMAPEQVDGLRLDARCDQYALGVSIYQLLTGQLPFDKEKPLDILVAQVREEPRPPRELRPDAPEWLERIILKMMAKAPVNRFASLTDVERALADGPGASTVVLPPPEKDKAPPAVRLEDIVALEKGVKAKLVAPPTWRPAIAAVAASFLFAVVFLGTFAREAFAGPGLGVADAPPIVQKVLQEVEARAASKRPEDVVAAIARLDEEGPALGPRGAIQVDRLRERLKKQLEEAKTREQDALEKAVDEALARERFAAAVEAADPSRPDVAALGLAQLAGGLRAKAAGALSKARGEVYVPAGPFASGPEGKPATLGGFYLDAAEVANAAWAAALEKGGLAVPATWPRGRLEDQDREKPVTGVSFEEAQAFARAVGKRLPAALEWEKAARGTGDARAFPWGDRFEPGRANLLDGGSGALEAVGERAQDASPFGARGMAGNALEWVAGESGALVAGGGFRSFALSGRVFERFAADPKTRHPAIGFRCARDVEKD